MTRLEISKCLTFLDFQSSRILSNIWWAICSKIQQQR